MQNSSSKVLPKLSESSLNLSKMPPGAPQRRPGSPFGLLENTTKSIRIHRNEPIPPKRYFWAGLGLGLGAGASVNHEKGKSGMWVRGHSSDVLRSPPQTPLEPLKKNPTPQSGKKQQALWTSSHPSGTEAPNLVTKDAAFLNTSIHTRGGRGLHQWNCH